MSVVILGLWATASKCIGVHVVRTKGWGARRVGLVVAPVGESISRHARVPSREDYCINKIFYISGSIATFFFYSRGFTMVSRGRSAMKGGSKGRVAMFRGVATSEWFDYPRRGNLRLLRASRRVG